MKLISGKEVYANGNIFGLTPDGELTGGYDNLFYDEDGGECELTPAEKCDIADEMLRRWTAFKALWSCQ